MSQLCFKGEHLEPIGEGPSSVGVRLSHGPKVRPAINPNPVAVRSGVRSSHNKWAGSFPTLLSCRAIP